MWYILTSETISVRTVFSWVKAFKAGKFSVEDDTRPGRHKTSVTKANIAAVKVVVEQDARLSVKDIVSCTGISEGSVQTILKKRLDQRKVCARWILHLVTEEQKPQRLICARELLKTYKGCNSRVIYNLLIGDETWVHMFEPQRRADNKQWKRKVQKHPCIAKRTIISIKDVARNFLKFKWASRSSALSIWSYSHWPIVKEFCTEERKRFIIRNDQAKDGQ